MKTRVSALVWLLLVGCSAPPSVETRSGKTQIVTQQWVECRDAEVPELSVQVIVDEQRFGPFRYCKIDGRGPDGQGIVEPRFPPPPVSSHGDGFDGSYAGVFVSPDVDADGRVNVRLEWYSSSAPDCATSVEIGPAADTMVLERCGHRLELSAVRHPRSN